MTGCGALTPFDVEALRLSQPGRAVEWLSFDATPVRIFVAYRLLVSYGLVDDMMNITKAGRCVLWALGVTW